LVYLFFFDPTVVTLHLGQVNLLLLVCICLMWEALRRNRGALAVALPLSVAIVIKTYPLLLLPLLVLRRRYKAAAWSLALFGLYCAVSYFVLPASVWPDWIKHVLPAGGDAHAGPWNQNIRAFIARAFLPNPFSEPLLEFPGIVKRLIYLLSFIVLAVSAWIAFLFWRRADESRRTTDFLFSLFLFAMFLIAPVSWEHHFVYLLPSLALLLTLLVSGEVRGHWRWIVALSLALIAWKLPITAPELTHGWRTLLISAKFYPAVALWLFFVVASIRVTKGRGEEAPEGPLPVGAPREG